MKVYVCPDCGGRLKRPDAIICYESMNYVTPVEVNVEADGLLSNLSDADKAKVEQEAAALDDLLNGSPRLQASLIESEAGRRR